MQGWRATVLCVTFHDSRKPGKLPASVSRTVSPRRGSGRGKMTGFSRRAINGVTLSFECKRAV